MSERATLSSKLRILVARAYKAERLYTSMRTKSPHSRNYFSAEKSSRNLSRNTSSVSFKEVTASQTLKVNSLISELSNELRASEWQNSYMELRLSLNNILEKNNLKTSNLTEEIIELYNQIAYSLEETQSKFTKITGDSSLAFENKEFLRCSKNSLELIRLKARLQAGSVIAEELTSLLNSSLKQKKIKKSELGPVLLLGKKPLGEDLDSPPKNEASDDGFDDFKIAVGDTSNVIPFKR